MAMAPASRAPPPVTHDQKTKYVVRRCEYSVDGTKLHCNFVWTPNRGAVKLQVVAVPEKLDCKEHNGRETFDRR
jgi:hypothetical protein